MRTSNYSRDSLVPTEEDLRVVLVKRALVVADGREVLDDDGVVGVLALLVEDRVRLDHVVDDVGLGDLLGAELALRAQVAPVVVAQVVVARDARQLDPGADEEVHERRLHLGLPGLEVVAPDERAVPLRELERPRHERVLRRAVDERRPREDARHGEHRRWRYLGVSPLDRL